MLNIIKYFINALFDIKQISHTLYTNIYLISFISILIVLLVLFIRYKIKCKSIDDANRQTLFNKYSKIFILISVILILISIILRICTFGFANQYILLDDVKKIIAKEKNMNNVAITYEDALGKTEELKLKNGVVISIYDSDFSWKSGNISELVMHARKEISQTIYPTTYHKHTKIFIDDITKELLNRITKTNDIKISLKEYNNKECYEIVFPRLGLNDTIYVQKDTGLILQYEYKRLAYHTLYQNISYDFNAVTDEDIIEPILKYPHYTVKKSTVTVDEHGSLYYNYDT